MSLGTRHLLYGVVDMKPIFLAHEWAIKRHLASLSTFVNKKLSFWLSDFPLLAPSLTLTTSLTKDMEVF